jgi:hypothetical protein
MILNRKKDFDELPTVFDKLPTALVKNKGFKGKRF